MKKLSLLLLLVSIKVCFGQYEMEKFEILKNGKIKTTHINYADKHSEPDYQQFKKISEIRNVKVVKGEVHSMEIYCEKSSTLRYSREFVARGNKNDDGTLDDVFGYYSERADMWAVPFDGSIYIINASIRNVTSSKDLVIPFVLGEEIASKLDLFNYYKAIYADYSGGKFEREERESREKMLEKKIGEERKLELWSIEKNELKSIKVIHKISSDVSYGKSAITIGIEADLANGTTVKSNYFGGVAIDSDYLFEVEGAYKMHESDDASVAGIFQFIVYSDEDYSWSDVIKVTVKRRSTGEVLVEENIQRDYMQEVHLDFSGFNGSRGYEGGDGANVVVDVEEIFHTETLEPLVLYTVRSDNGYTQTLNYVKMSPTAKMQITYYGGKGGDGNLKGLLGGKKGSLIVNADPQVTAYNLTHYGADGESGSADYQGDIVSKNNTNSSNSSSSSSTSSEITIKNNTGKSVCISHYGGSTSIGNGSSESFSCRDLFYGVMDGANCTGTKGAKIADEDDDCGRTISLD